MIASDRHVAIKRILCPVDLSGASCHAAAHAVALAGWLKASVIGLHVYDPVFAPISTLSPSDQHASDAELVRLRGATAACFSEAGAPDIEIVIDVGSPARCIVDRAASLAADLVVLGTHGASGFERLLLGSVAEKVVRTAPCPVLTVPPRAAAAGATEPFRRVVCAVDFSSPSLEGVRLASEIAREAGSSLTLVHVIEWPWHEPPAPAFDELPPPQAAALSAFRQLAEKTAETKLHDTAAALRLTPPVACRVVHGKSHLEILRVADDVDADLIVVGLHGRNPADLMLLGSTTNQIVRQARCPVLTVRR